MSWTNASLIFEAAASEAGEDRSVYSVVLDGLEGAFTVRRRSIHPQLVALSILLGA